MSIKMYELAQSYLNVLELYENDDIDQETLLNTLESIEDAIQIKAENIVKFMKNIKAEADAIKEEENRLNAKRKALENKHESLKRYLEDSLRQTKIEKIKCGNFTVGFQKSPASVEVVSEEELPQEFKIAQPDKIDKKELLSKLKDGHVIKGAKLVNDKTHLRIR